jgi:hypothetical protein
MCGKRKNGIAIRDDRVLQSLRWFKGNVTHSLQGNDLVVCSEDMEEYKKKRDRFTSRKNLYVALGVIFAILGLIISISINTILLSVLVIAALYLISLVNYTPGLATDQKKTAKIKHKQ